MNDDNIAIEITHISVGNIQMLQTIFQIDCNRISVLYFKLRNYLNLDNIRTFS